MYRVILTSAWGEVIDGGVFGTERRAITRGCNALAVGFAAYRVRRVG